MKKSIICLMAAIMLSMGLVNSNAADTRRGGFMGFIAGCCFGIRAGAAYNDGKEIHWREWLTLIPYVGIVFSIWNGIDGANGMESSDLAAKYGASFY